jgi:dTDP-4-amino-4,6-dideoxygalactose transaminase
VHRFIEVSSLEARRILPVSDHVAPYTAAGGAKPAASSEPVPEITRVPLMDPTRVYAEWGQAAEADVLAILRSHQYVKGRHVAGLEREFAEYIGVEHAVAVDSCTDALFLVLRAVFDRCGGDEWEVILPTFTFVATAGAVVNAGGRPVFADVCADTYNLDPESVSRLVNDRTAAVIPVHLFGNPMDLEELRASLPAGREDLFLLEDAAQAVHATWKGLRVGSIGNAGTFSFYPSKNLGAAGDGGIVTTDDADLAHTVAALRDHGQNRKMYDHDLVGTNSRMDEIQAAVLRAKLPRIGEWTRARRAVAARYDLAFKGTSARVQQIPDGAESAYHLYTVVLEERDRVREALQARGVSTGVYYPLPLHRQTCFARYEPSPCPVADDLSEHVLSLPCFPGLTPEEQDVVIEVVRDALAS